MDPEAHSRAEDRLFQSVLNFVYFVGILRFKTAVALCLRFSHLEDGLPQQNFSFLGAWHLKLMGGVKPNEVFFFTV